MICGTWKWTVAATLAGLAVLGTGAAFAHGSSYFNPTGLYDCSAPNATTGGIVYDYSFQFATGHRYSIGDDVKGKLTGKIQSGTYKLSGQRILGVTGPLAKLHESLLIQTSDLALLDKNGNFTRVGCRLHTSSSGGGGGGGGTGSIPLGDYSCWHTTQYSATGYSTVYRPDLHLYSDGTYQLGYAPRSGTAWHASGTKAIFTKGPLWAERAHDVGIYYASGVTMPHAQGTFAGEKFTFVIRDTEREGGVPPYKEFSTTDDPNAAQSQPMSWDYCKPNA